jgi:transmembrane sensor
VEYENAPLSRVVADLDSTAPLPIEFADKKLAELRVSGRIRLTDPLRQINNLSIIHGFSIEKTDNSIIISGD